MKPIIVRYDLRAPAWLGSETARLYPALLEQCAWADSVPELTSVGLSEHHGVDDGYCPSPVVVAGAVAARTARLGITLAALVLPLHDPLRVAEDLAVLDILSRGRTVVVFAAGYRAVEFSLFDKPMAGRGAWLEEAVALVRAAWRGEPVRAGETTTLTPPPFTPGGPPVLLGGSSVAAARRAARVADGFLPSAADPELAAAYRDERARLGLEEGYVGRADGPAAVFVAEDPDAFWARLAPHALHETNSYGEWEAARPGTARYYEPAEDAGALRASGRYPVLTPDECVRLFRELPEDGGLVLHPLLGGLDPELGWSSLELFRDRVLPRLREEDV